MGRAADRTVGAGSPRDAPGQAVALASNNGHQRAFGSQRIGQILGEWQTVELRIARGFAECRGMSTEQLEDVYQETALALYNRPYTSEEHLRNALRTGIKQRALRLHRDEHRHSQILARNAPGLQLISEAREDQNAPELSVLAEEDRLIAKEFIAELNDTEQRVFACVVEGMGYRAIASTENMLENEARNIVRACERKREHFQTLYDAGRLCGYRAQTIHALQNGQSTSEELAERAFAHLESCIHCRLEHKTNAKRLRRSFRDQAAALLPPVLIGHLDWTTRLGVRTRLLLHRLGIQTTPLAGGGGGGVRERAVAMLAGAGAGAKIAVGVLTVGVLAGGALTTHVLEQSQTPAHPHPARSAIPAPPPQALSPPSVLAPVPSPRTSVHRSTGVHPSNHPRPRQRHAGTRHAVSVTHSTMRSSTAAGQREPGGFAYLGVPTSAPATPAPAASSSEGQHGGGQFSP